MRCCVAAVLIGKRFLGGWSLWLIVRELTVRAQSQLAFIFEIAQKLPNPRAYPIELCSYDRIHAIVNRIALDCFKAGFLNQADQFGLGHLHFVIRFD